MKRLKEGDYANDVIDRDIDNMIFGDDNNDNDF